MTRPRKEPADLKYGRCPHCKWSCISRSYDKWLCKHCGRKFDEPVDKPMRGSGVIAPLTYRQQILRDRLAALQTTIQVRGNYFGKTPPK